MNTVAFKYALEVEKTGSISRAAENLFIAQPNLSKTIKELENQLDIRIFKRTSRGVIPTPEGEEFLGYARKINEQLCRMESLSIPRAEREARQSFRFSMPRGSYISAAFADFVGGLDLQRSIDIEVCETNSMQTISNVAESGFNLGVIRYQMQYENYFMDYLKEKQLDHKVFWEFSCLVLMSERHPLAQRETIDYDELKDSSIEIIHGDNVVPYLAAPAMDMHHESTPLSKRIYVYERGSQLEILTRVPRTFMWVSPLPDELLRRFALVQRVCHLPDNVFRDVLIYSRKYLFNAVDKAFLNKLSEVQNELAFSHFQ